MTTQTDRNAIPGRLAHDTAARIRERKMRMKSMSQLAQKSALRSPTPYAAIKHAIAANRAARKRTN